MTAYPPEPWDLRGQLHVSAFLVPLTDVPVDLPAGCRPVRVRGRGVVGVAWVDYEPAGVLAYREVMATLLVRRGWRLMPTIVRIWVDSEASRDGGRELWGIPKELATFGFRGESFEAHDEKGLIASAVVRPRLPLPGRIPLAFHVVQRRRGEVKQSRVRVRAQVVLSSATLDVHPAGPLGFVAGRRALMSAGLRDFRLSFGGR